MHPILSLKLGVTAVLFLMLILGCFMIPTHCKYTSYDQAHLDKITCYSLYFRLYDTLVFSKYITFTIHLDMKGVVFNKYKLFP